MKEQEIVIYLDMLKNKIAKTYNIPISISESIIKNSPMRQLLYEEPEYITHYSLKYWANFLYDAWRK